MTLEKAQKIVASVGSGERNFVYSEWDRDEAICTVLVEVQKELDYQANKIKEML